MYVAVLDTKNDVNENYKTYINFAVNHVIAMYKNLLPSLMYLYFELFFPRVFRVNESSKKKKQFQ